MMRPPQSARKCTGLLAWCLLGSLAWSQLSFAAHQFNHSALEAGETCVVCVQFDRNDHAAVDSAAAPLPHAGAIIAHAEPPVAIAAHGFSHYAARASP